MNDRIIYPNGLGGVAVVIPSGELPIDDVAAKDVPAGTPYLLISASDLPTDRVFRTAWEADFTTPHGYGMGDEAWYAQRQAAQEATQQAAQQAAEEATQQAAQLPLTEPSESDTPTEPVNAPSTADES